jgi:hypothetical protein
MSKMPANARLTFELIRIVERMVYPKHGLGPAGHGRVQTGHHCEQKRTSFARITNALGRAGFWFDTALNPPLTQRVASLHPLDACRWKCAREMSAFVRNDVRFVHEHVRKVTWRACDRSSVRRFV